MGYDVKVRSSPSFFCGQPRTSVLKADCCEGHTHRKPGVRYGSDSTLRKRGGSSCHPAIVVDTTTAMAPISAVDDVVASIVAKSSLAFGTLAAPAVGGLAEPSAELLRSLPKETLAATVRLLAFDRTNSAPGVDV